MLNYTDTGHGKVIIFIHGFCESLNIWQQFEEEFSKFCRVICIDLPGYGGSRLEEEIISIDWFADQVVALTKELSIDKFCVVGHSLGGYVSLAIAEKYPQKLENLVLFHSTAYADTPVKKENRDKAADFILRNGLAKYMDSFVEPLFASANREKCKTDIQKLMADGKRSDQEAVIQTIQAMKERPDRTHVLAGFLKPILMIIGEDDIAVPLADSQKQVELNATIQSIILQNCGHMGMYEKPTTCITRLKEFYFS